MSEKKLVCHGAVCKCSFGDFPDTLVVSSQQKHYINDTRGSQKLMATDKELGAPFQAKTFGQCKMQPTGSSFKPCMPAITAWDGFFEKTQVQSNGGFPLLEDSKATCSFGGAPCVEITFHGQVAVPSAQNVANADPEVLSQIMPLINVNEIDTPDPYGALQIVDENSEFDEVQEEQQQETPAKVIVHFRPRNWNGEYGFDWYRNNANERRDNRKNYDHLIGKYYNEATFTTLFTDENSWSRFFQRNITDLTTLKNTYSPFSSYSIEDDANGIPITTEYFIPKLALFAQTDNLGVYEAELQLYMEYSESGDDKPERIEFDIPTTTPISLDLDDVTETNGVNTYIIENPANKKRITVTCRDSFNDDFMLIAYAIKGSSRTEVGKLQIIAPAKKIVKDIVVIQVKTKEGTGDIRETKLNKAKGMLKQALITLNVTRKTPGPNGVLEDIKIDITDPNNNFRNTDFDARFRNPGSDDYINTSAGLVTFLDQQLRQVYPGQFNNHFKLFCLNEEYITGITRDEQGNEYKSKVGGYSALNAPYAVLFSNLDEDTLAHEMLHGFGLHHTFANNAPYTYRAQQTYNIMDYSHLIIDKADNTPHTPKNRFHTWYWQWRVINSNL